MKKGINYVDWVIAIGIFIVYIIFIFVVFKPGIRESYSPSYMLDIIKTNLVESTHYSIEKVSLFVDYAETSQDNNGDGIPDSETIELQFPFKWQDGNTRIRNTKNNGIINKQILDEDSNLNTPNTLKIEDKFLDTSETKEYLLIYNNEQTFSNDFPSSTTKNSNLYSPRFGIKSELKGISVNNLNQIKNSEYSTLKSNWHFPLPREFSISITKIQDPSFSYLDYQKITPIQDAKVFVLQYKDDIIEDEGTKIPVLVIIRTW